MLRNQHLLSILVKGWQIVGAFAAPVTNCTNKYIEAFILSKQTVKVIVPTVVLIAGQKITA